MSATQGRGSFVSRAPTTLTARRAWSVTGVSVRCRVKSLEARPVHVQKECSVRLVFANPRLPPNVRVGWDVPMAVTFPTARFVWTGFASFPALRGALSR